jgi:hypothetical protein
MFLVAGSVNVQSFNVTQPGTADSFYITTNPPIFSDCRPEQFLPQLGLQLK